MDNKFDNKYVLKRTNECFIFKQIIALKEYQIR